MTLAGFYSCLDPGNIIVDVRLADGSRDIQTWTTQRFIEVWGFDPNR